MRERSQHIDPLDAAIDAGLRRRFSPPPGLERRLILPAPVGKGAAGRWALFALALTAAAALVVLSMRPPQSSPVDPPLVLFEGLAVAVAGIGAGPSIGPFADPEEVPTDRRPDLGLLYHTMAAAHRAETVSACDEGDRLGERLESIYGPGVRLEPSAAGRLHGPFASPEWPTGTILTGTTGGQTSVLIAESDETLSCCTDIRLPENSGLQVFTWRMGNVAMTEITTLGEPRLIEECFQ